MRLRAEDVYLRPRGVAAILNVTEQKVWAWIAAGKLPGLVLSRRHTKNGGRPRKFYCLADVLKLGRATDAAAATSGRGAD